MPASFKPSFFPALAAVAVAKPNQTGVTRASGKRVHFLAPIHSAKGKIAARADAYRSLTMDAPGPDDDPDNQEFLAEWRGEFEY